MPRVGLVWFLLSGLSRAARGNEAAATTENCTFATCSSDEVWNNFLPSNYSKSEPPVVDGMAVLVNVSMKIVDVDDINEERMDFRLHTYIEESWRDGRLRTSPFADRWRRMSVPRRVARLMWTPDVVFSNTKRSSIFRQSVDSVAYKIARDGSVHRLTRYLFQVRCLMTFHKYPMDIQHCHFKVSLLATPNSITELCWEASVDDKGESLAIEFVDRIEPLQFRIKRPKVHRYSENFLGENYTHLLANFTFERRLTASIVNTYIPSGLVVVLSWLSFWLDVHAVQGRITLGVTAILTLTTQVVQSRTALPPVDYVKAVDIWLFACLVSVFTSLLEYAVAYQYVKSQRIGFQGDGAIADEDITENDVLGSAESMASTVSHHGNLPAPSSSRFPIKPLLQPSKLLTFLSKFRFLSISSSNVFDSVSRAVFPSVFVLFMIAYWAHYLPSGKPGH
ncbi:glycine receptor subunit alphaZ1 [Rhipicephalus microplus]|uniref:glycine receptor subunit alphaZ1 n=1 Tax=Rhipicephalus microplus TaxID=6941 RepID=UPI003F6C5581